MAERHLTLVIPTRNRFDFLRRGLLHYWEQGFPYPIFVVDSSQPAVAEQSASFVSQMKDKLDVSFFANPPEIHILDKLTRALGQAQTPYAVLGADDDFFVQDGLERAVQFLQDHPDYTAAFGETILFGLRSGIQYGPMAWVKDYLQRDIEDGTAGDRLIDLFRSYTPTWYSMRRTDELRECLQRGATWNLDNAFLELLPSGLTVIQGKVKRLDGLMTIRQFHSQMTSAFDSFDWITEMAWVEQFRRVQVCLTEALARQGQIREEESQQVVKKALWFYLCNVLTRFQPDQNKEPPRFSFRQIAREIPGLYPAWQWMKRHWPRSKHEISLEAFLHARSVYHSVFFPVYQRVIQAT